MGSARDILPLDIATFLMETHHLNPVETCAYMHLQIHYWRHGALPTDAESLASIAQIPMHAWSIAQAQLMHLFSIGQDGVLHSANLDRKRADWFGKQQRAKEKARKAANARWAKHWGRKGEDSGENSPDLRHAQASAKHELNMVHGSSLPSLAGSPHTPFLEPIYTHFPGEAHAVPRNPLPLGSARASLAIDGPASPDLAVLGGAPWLMPESSDLGPLETHRSVNKAKQSNLASRTVVNVGNGTFPHPTVTASHEAPLRLSAGHSKKSGNLHFGSEPADARFEAFSEEIFAFWEGQNPKGGKCPWMHADRRALAQLLKAAPDMTLEEFKRLLSNRARSDLNPAALPRDWVGRIQEFSEGRLDRFKRPARSPRTL